MKKTVVTLVALIVLSTCSSSFALLSAPTYLDVNPGSWGISFEWDAIPEAAKYSIDVEGIVGYSYWYWNGYWWQLRWDWVEVSISMGTSDWYIYDMADPWLWIWKSDFAGLLADAIYDATENVPAFISGFWGDAKVKALDPGKTKGPQNNPFSDYADCNIWLNQWIW